ncbi:MAG: bifunctional folylpolyglutamate synthase/dihydrofolate synthase [Clostridia bacterium]|nr:bifunctional folylpolyglutamate synthase/dihydrofolate synthase [Clostridia bacterium]
MDYKTATEYINSFLVFGSKPGLERIALLLDKLGNPQNKLKFIHVAGTNGKGSICAYTASILQSAGYKTGLFISPYILDFRERFQINGEMIEESTLARLTEQLKAVVDTLNDQDKPTEFELITALAMMYFEAESCDVVVLEVGLGGRFDSTNIIPTPLCSVIASISLDHIAVLGDTIDKIAFEKAGIIKNGGKTVCYPIQQDSALNVIKSIASQRDNAFILPDVSSVQVTQQGFEGDKVRYGDLCFTLPILGKCQPYNAATAIEAVRCSGLKVSDEQIVNGIQQTQFPARCEVLRNNPLILIDGAHNPDGAYSLFELLTKTNTKPVAVMGMMADKDVDSVMSILAPCFDEIYTVTVSNPRSMTANELKEIAEKYCSKVTAFDSQQMAIDTALSLNKDLCVCGSFYLAADVRNYLKNR